MASPAVVERPGARPAPAPARPAPAPGPTGPVAAPTGTGTALGARPTDAAGPRVRLSAPPSADEVSLKGSGTFAPPQSVVDRLATQRRGGDVAVRFPGVAAGVIHVVKHGDKYNTPGLQAIEIDHPALNPLRAVNNLSPVLAIQISNSTVTGHVTVSTGKGPPRGDIFGHIQGNAEKFGLVGLNHLSLPKVENKLADGKLTLKSDLAFTLGGYLSGKGSFGLADDAITFAAHAQANVRDVADLAFDLVRSPDGVISGHGEAGIKVKKLTGNFIITFVGGIVDVTGTFRFATDTLTGELTGVITDEKTAQTVARQHLPPEAIAASAHTAAGGSTVAAAPAGAGPKPGPRAVAGWGSLDVHYSDWLTGKALAVLDAKGHVTVIGDVTPPAKIEFQQTKLDYEPKTFGLEVRATYGLPYVGDVFLFASVSLFAIAKVSPLTLSKIEIHGVYSTDPEVLRSFSLSANLNLSALAGLRLRAEGGLGIEILDHDIKIGAALLATAGIRAYLDAMATIGMRELADPETGRRREYYIGGDAEIAAQPFLSLGGELFVKLETPWWSPVSDHTWTWPLGELFYPLPGEFGIGIDFDYVLGSGKLPTISPKKVDFNADRFMSDLMDDKTPKGPAAEVQKPAVWKERLQAPPPPPATPQVVKTTSKPSRKDNAPAKNDAKAFAGGVQAIEALRKRADATPTSPAEVAAQLDSIRRSHGMTSVHAKPDGPAFEVTATRGKVTLPKPVRIKIAPGADRVPRADVAAALRPVTPTGPPPRVPGGRWPTGRNHSMSRHPAASSTTV